MKMRKCTCGGTPKVYEFVVQCSECRTSTYCYTKTAQAIKQWNEGSDLIVRHKISGNKKPPVGADGKSGKTRINKMSIKL